MLLRLIAMIAIVGAATVSGADTDPLISFTGSEEDYDLSAGTGIYRVHYNYTGQDWTHADVAGIKVETKKPIAILPMQYTEHRGCNPAPWLLADISVKSGTRSRNARWRRD